MDHNQRIDSGEQYAKRRPDELIEKYIKIKQTLNHYDNLPNALKHFPLFRRTLRKNNYNNLFSF